MTRIDTLEPYADEQGNRIIYEGEPLDDSFTGTFTVTFKGGNNTVVVSPHQRIADLRITFEGDDGRVEIGASKERRTRMRFTLRVGHQSLIRVGDNVGCQGRAFVSAVEGADVIIGADSMLSTNIDLRSDDSHPIYDSRSGKRLNASRSITIGEHVWLGKYVTVLGGATIGSGSVIGWRSIVTKDVPNNCIAVGAPAQVVRKNVAWERPMVVHRKPGEKYPRPGERTPEYWAPTHGGTASGSGGSGSRGSGAGGPVVTAVAAPRRMRRFRRLKRFVPERMRPWAASVADRAEVTAGRAVRVFRRAR